MPKVTIYTQVYNAGKYLKPCLDSVINQTDPDWQWILVDSCSTDGSPAMIDEYAAGDPRIIPIHMPENRLDAKDGFIQQYAAGKYIATLDHDDWWEPDYIEKLWAFAEENNLDYAMTGVEQFFQDTGISATMRKMSAPAVMTVDEFARDYPSIGPFAGAQWANLIRTDRYLDLLEHPEKQRSCERSIVWRFDTLYMLDHLENSRRIGIETSVLYHYRRYDGSQISKYNPTFFKSNVVFYERLKAFLERHGAMNDDMGEYLKERHLGEMHTTLVNIGNAELPAEEKLRRFAEIAEHPLTVHALTCACEERERWWQDMLAIFDWEFRTGRIRDPDAAKNVLGGLAPSCADMLSPEGLELFRLEEKELLPAFADDDWHTLARRILTMLVNGRYSKKFDLAALFRGLLPENTPFRCVRDNRFFKRHGEIAALVLDEGYRPALEHMTGELLEGKPVYAEEDFLQLYLTLAALENEVSAFLFGKVRLAKLYAKEGRLEEARAVLAELEEMGAGDVEGAAELREALKKR